MVQAHEPILIVEDVRSDAWLLERAIKKTRLNNPLQFVSDGAEAVAYLSGDGAYADRRQFPLPLLVLLDLKLPKKDGFEVLRWIKQQGTFKRLPVVVLTSSNLSPDIDRAFQIGADSYLVKPVEDQALVEMLHNLDCHWVILKGPDEQSGPSPRQAD